MRNPRFKKNPRLQKKNCRLWMQNTIFNESRGITRNHEESRGITRNHEESRGITKNHEESRRITKNHEKSRRIKKKRMKKINEESEERIYSSMQLNPHIKTRRRRWSAAAAMACFPKFRQKSMKISPKNLRFQWKFSNILKKSAKVITICENLKILKCKRCKSLFIL